MKKTLYIAAAAFSLLAVSCAKELEGNKISGGIIAHASLQPVEATKAVGQYSYNIVWETNDKIAVLDNANNKASFSLKEGVGSTTGTFKQDGTDDLTAPLTAYYPASVVTDGNALVWPATQTDVKNITNVPMTASSSAATGNVNFAFKHLGAVLQLVLTAKDGEINVKRIDITADQNLSGEFTVQDGTAVMPAKQGETPATSITTGDISSQSIKLTAKATYLNFAVPAGSFTNYRIVVTDTDDNTYSLTAPSLSIQRAMVNKLPAALNAGVLFVNGHKVTVKLADDVASHDIMTEVYVDGITVKIDAFSRTGKGISCGIAGNAACNKTKTDNFYTFTISDITSDVTAKIGYQLVKNISFNKTNVNLPKGWVSHVLTATASPDDAVNKAVNWSSEPTDIVTVDENGTLTAVKEGEATITATAADGSGVTATCTVNVSPPIEGSLSHEFSVSASLKVHFSKGNLYVSRPNFSSTDWIRHFYDEQYQYNSLSTGNSRTATAEDTEIDLFTWGYNADNLRDPIGQNYVGGHNEDGEILDEYEDWGFSFGGPELTWRTLTSAEWKYLFNKDNDYGTNNRSGKYKYGVTVCGKTNCVVLLPDDWQWGQNGVGDTWQNKDNVIEYSEETIIKWSAMEAAGAVCLPAAGRRNGSNVSIVGDSGFYWSSTAHDSSRAYDVYFDSGDVSPDYYEARSFGFSVRLITESK